MVGIRRVIEEFITAYSISSKREVQTRRDRMVVVVVVGVVDRSKKGVRYYYNFSDF
jgi:predicted RNase H-related nuclease YkuK (DUF458 family)